MHSYISSFEVAPQNNGPADTRTIPIQPVPHQYWGRATVCAVLILISAIVCWEWYWRSFGSVPGYVDEPSMWARERRRIDQTEGDATVLIGSSRTVFDIQLPVWERLSGHRPIQLARNANSPMLILDDLSKDNNFHGRLIVGIAPDFFFTGFEWKGLIRYLNRESLAQRTGKFLSMHLVEPYFAFYDPAFALFPDVQRLPWPERPGLPGYFPVKTSIVESDRNTFMWSKVSSDTSYLSLVRMLEALNFHEPTPTARQAAENRKVLELQITRAVAAVGRLRARGVTVVFVRDPSDGEYLIYENREFPRKDTWDVLVRNTGAGGIHFEDYQELQGYELPEWSHMTRASAVRYTEALYSILSAQFAPQDGSRW